MKPVTDVSRIKPAWWATLLVAFIVGLVATTIASYSGSFSSYVTIWVTSDRAGLVMDPGGKVKMRGVPVGRVAAVDSEHNAARLRLELFPDQIKNIPANTEAHVRASTAFGAKYVDLIYPADPSSQRIAPGAQLRSRNVSTEVQTVFDNLVNLLNKIEPNKLNAVLSALAQAVRGRGETMGTAIVDADDVLNEMNSRGDLLKQNWNSLQDVSDSYAGAAQNILAILDAATVSSATIASQATDLDELLLNATGFSQSGIDLLGPNQDNLVTGINALESTTSLLNTYSPEYTCLLLGANYLTENAPKSIGGNGRSIVLDAGLGWPIDPYRYPDHLPIVAAKGGPGGKPGCGSLPYVEDNWPQRYLVTNTGFGTGLDMRPNPGIAHPWWVNFFPVTRAVPEQPSIRGAGPPAIGPVPYPGAPPYGAPLYGPGGTPLYPGVPPAPTPPTDSASAPPP